MAKNLAIVIGINNYRDEVLQTLKYAKRDAELICEFLNNQAGFTEVCLFSEDSLKFKGCSTRPFRTSLRKFLREQFEDSFLEKEDHLWFFFSGHGIRYEDKDYLLPEDGDPNDPVDSAIPLNWVTERLSRSGSGNIVLILDACRNEVGRKGGSGFGEEMQEGVTTIFSCKPKESSWEIDDPIGQGAFTHILLETFLSQTLENCLTTYQTERRLQQRVFELNQQHKKTRQTPHIQISQIAKAQQILLPHLLSQKLSEVANINLPSGNLDGYAGCTSDWEYAPYIDSFYDREQELEQLQKWIVSDRSFLVVLYGMGGIGKTSLAIKAAQQVEQEFEVLVWRSLKQTPTLNDLIMGVERFINPIDILPSEVTIDESINRLLDSLKKRRCLIILDDLESIFEAEKIAGKYRQGYHQYAEFIRRVASENHKSCLILVSNEKVRDLLALENKKVHSLQIEGSRSIAKKILANQGLEESDDWNKVIENYGSHPLGLKIVITMIKDLYDGQVENFVAGTNGTAYFNFQYLMDQQFARLSSSERKVMYTISTFQRPVSIAELYADSWLNLPQSELIEVMTSLRGRSLLERNQTNFSLQPMIWRHIVEKFIEEISLEIMSFLNSPEINYLTTLKIYPWQIDGEKDNRLLFLIHRYFKSKPLARALPNMVKALEENHSSQSGYAIENLQALIKLLGY